jgi:hypothetical protein
MNSYGNGSGARTGNTLMRDALLHALQQEVAFDGCIMSKMQAVARQLVAKALAGDMRAIKEVFDRIDGKARPAVIAREQPMEAQTGIGLAEQLRQLTAIPPLAAAGTDEHLTPSVDMPSETGSGIASPLPISEPPASSVSSPIVARELPPVSPSDLARASRLAVDVLAERTQRENPRATPDVHRAIAAQSEAAAHGLDFGQFRHDRSYRDTAAPDRLHG